MKRIMFYLALFTTSMAGGQQHIGLTDALRLAEQNSPVLQSAQAEAAASRAASRAAKAQYLPQLSANGFATTGNQTSILSSAPMVEPSAIMMTAPGTFLDGNLMLMVPLIATRLSAMASAADWQARAAAGELSETRADLELRVTEAYYQVLLDRRMIEAAEAKATASQELVKNAQAQFEAGSAIEASVQRAQAELAAAQRSVTRAKNEEAKALLDLKEAIGLKLAADIVVDEGGAERLQSLSLDEAIKRANQQRGLLIAARARIQAAKAEVRAAEGRRAPQLFGVVMGDAGNRREMGGVTAGITLSFPVFDGGRISAEVAQAQAMKTRSESQLRAAELTVEREVRQAALDLETVRANLSSAEASEQATKAAYYVMVLRMSAGKAILVELLDALETLTRTRADLAQARFDLELASARLIRATGGRK